MIAQVGILISGVTAIWLTQDKRQNWRRWACIFGLAGQPFWLYATISSEQWGMVAVCVLYTFAWVRGVWTNWIRA